MMLAHTLLALFLVPVWLVSAQSSNSRQEPSQSESAQVRVTTSVIESVGLGPNRQTTTFLSTTVVTFTESPEPTQGGNNTRSGSNSASPTSSAKPLPTAPSDVPGGGGPRGAPVPSGNGPNALGPDDDWISGALAVRIPNMGYAVTILGLLIGGAAVL